MVDDPEDSEGTMVSLATEQKGTPQDEMAAATEAPAILPREQFDWGVHHGERLNRLHIDLQLTQSVWHVGNITHWVIPAGHAPDEVFGARLHAPIAQALRLFEPKEGDSRNIDELRYRVRVDIAGDQPAKASAHHSNPPLFSHPKLRDA